MWNSPFMQKSKKPVKKTSVKKQQQFQQAPPFMQNWAKNTMPDFDRDGVPNRFDCRPRNPRMQEEFEVIDIDGNYTKITQIGKNRFQAEYYTGTEDSPKRHILSVNANNLQQAKTFFLEFDKNKNKAIQNYNIQIR